jgi:hypothetical protein
VERPAQPLEQALVREQAPVQVPEQEQELLQGAEPLGQSEQRQEAQTRP